MPAIGNITCLNGTAALDALNDGNDGMHSLLYIVVTLLFYSMGIVIGIITYLKREQAEMEEDKMFEMYLQLKREPFNLHKKERVQQMAVYLKQLEERREARERVENWRTTDDQLQHLPTCLHHSPYLPGSEGWVGHGLAPPGVCDNDWAESGGGPALLCSLTLGVCEPLLTPETVKHVAFPDVPSTEIDPNCVGFFHQAQPRCQCGAIKSAFKSHSPVRLSSAIKKTAISAQVVCPNQCQDIADSYTKEITPNNDKPDTCNDYCDINQVDMQIIDEVLPVFQKCSLFLALPGRTEKSSVVLPMQRSMSFTDSLVSRTPVSRKLSLDLRHGLTGLAVHSFGTPRGRIKKDGNALSLERLPLTITNAFQYNDITPDQQCDAVKAVEETYDTLTENNTEDFRTLELAKRECTESSAAVPETSPYEVPRQHTHAISMQLPNKTLPSAESQSSLPIQLALFLTQAPLDARPKIFPLADIPKSMSLDESVDGAASENYSANAKRRLRNPKYDSWKKGHHQTVDIPDLYKSQPSEHNNKIAVHQRKSSLPRSHPPARENERRGALFFTQKALHKENDGPKQSGLQRQGRHGGLMGRQESVDSSNNSDLSDSPLLHVGANDCAAVLNLSSASSSAGSSSMSPPATSKHQGRIPRLMRSYTEETAKLLKK